MSAIQQMILSYTPATGGGSIKKRTITIDHTKCGSTDSTNFPVLVSISDSTLKTISNGGHVNNSNGYDIVFYSDSGYTSIMNWEMEFYDGVNGIVIAWVKVGTVSHTSDTVFYMKYGDTAISTFQGGSIGAAWNSAYKGVWHLGNGSTLSALDSTSNGNNGTITTPTAASGQIDGAALFGGSDYIEIPSAPVSGYPLTFEAWTNCTTTSGDNVIMSLVNKGALEEYWVGWFNGSLRSVIQGSGLNDIILSGVSISGWHHVVATFASASSFILYYDGANVGNNFGAPTPSGIDRLYIGGLFYNTSNFYGGFNGKIDEARISNVARGDDWILTSYNNQNAPGNVGSGNFLTYGVET